MQTGLNMNFMVYRRNCLNIIDGVMKRLDRRQNEEKHDMLAELGDVHGF